MVHLFEAITDLTDFQRHSLITRYVTMIESVRSRSQYYAFIFHVSRTIVTVGSLIVPALLSIQYTGTGPTGIDSASLSYVIYWVTWVISLLVTTSNGILTLFKVDKKYYFLHTTLEQLRSEAWQYIHLSGRYGQIIDGILPDHKNQFILFTHNLEKIKLKQVEEEYYKMSEQQAQQTGADKQAIETVVNGKKVNVNSLAGLYAPTPDMKQLLARQREIALANALKPRSPVDGGEGVGYPPRRGSQIFTNLDAIYEEETIQGAQITEKERETPVEGPERR
jgi:hypothetical protein